MECVSAHCRSVIDLLALHADATLLRAIASSPSDYYFAPGPEDLAAIYQAVAGEIRCSP